MSFGESMFSAGFIQKNTKGGLFVNGNHVIPQQNRHGKTLEDSRSLSTEADPEGLPCGAGVVEPPKLYGPHVPVIVLQTSNYCTWELDNPDSLSGVLGGPRIIHIYSLEQDPL